MTLMGFSFPSLRIPSEKSFKPVLPSAGILGEAGNQVFTYNYCVKQNHQEVIQFLATILLTTMQPMDWKKKKENLDVLLFHLSWPWLGLTAHVSSTAWSAKMTLCDSLRGVLHVPWAQAGHGAGMAMDFCRVCTWIWRENAELPPEPGSWNYGRVHPKYTQGCAGVGCFTSCCQGISFQLGKIC